MIIIMLINMMMVIINDYYHVHYDDVFFIFVYWPIFDLCLPLSTLKTIRKIIYDDDNFDDYEP